MFTFSFLSLSLKAEPQLFIRQSRKKMPKKNPQKSHHEWMEIHLITIRRMGELEKEKAEIEREKTKLEEEKQ